MQLVKNVGEIIFTGRCRESLQPFHDGARFHRKVVNSEVKEGAAKRNRPFGGNRSMAEIVQNSQLRTGTNVVVIGDRNQAGQIERILNLCLFEPMSLTRRKG